MSDKKNVFGGAVLAIAIAGAIGFGKYYLSGSSGQSTEERLQAEMFAAADQINADAPIMIDEDTRLESASAADRRFRYNYTMVSYEADELDPEVFASHMWPQLKSAVCTQEEMAVFMDNRIPVIYAYYGKEGREIATLTVEHTDCEPLTS